MLTEKSFDAGEIVINFAESDTVGPPLVMLHGATLNWQTFGDFIPTLEQRWHLYVCDLRGHGRSGRARSGYAFENYIPDTLAFIERQVGKPVVLAGFSLGAAIALSVAARLPEQVRALILLEPPLCHVRDDGLQSIPGLEDWWTWLKQTLAASHSLEDVIACCKLREPDNDEAGRLSQAQMVYHLDPGSIDAILNNRAFINYKPEQLFPRLACPTLLVCGETSQGSSMNAADVELYQQHVPHGLTFHLKDVGHDVIWGPAGQATLEQVTAFLNSL